MFEVVAGYFILFEFSDYLINRRYKESWRTGRSVPLFRLTSKPSS
jgi:hypothetical protein